MSEPLTVPVLSQQQRARRRDRRCRPSVFGGPVRRHLLYETVKMQLANRRAGTAATKTRAFVRGGGKKPWRQKGTGRARAGSIALADLGRRRDDLRSAAARLLVPPAGVGTQGGAALRRWRRRCTTASCSCSTRSSSTQPKTKVVAQLARRPRIDERAHHHPARDDTPRAGGAQSAAREGAARRGRQRLRHPALRASGADAGGGRCAEREARVHEGPLPRHRVSADHREGHVRQRAGQSGRLPRRPDANKVEIRRAVETLFKVKVEKVRTLNFLGKTRRVGRSIGQQAALEEGVRDAGRGAAHRLLRERVEPWRRVNTSRPRPAAASRAVLDFSEITDKEPERRCSRRATRTGGRNALGRMTIRHRGGGHKRRYRHHRLPARQGRVPAKVAAIEYDPNRSARLALLHYADGEKRYILAPVGLARRRHGDRPGEGADIKPGNALPLCDRSRSAPWCTTSSSSRAAAGSSVRGAGAAAQLMAKEGTQRAARSCPPASCATSSATCRATIGQVGNVDHENVSIGKAGRNRWLGQAPAGARHRHEPGRSPARRWRGPVEGQSSAVAVGPADQGLQDAAQPAHRSLHRQAAEPIGAVSGTFGQEGTIHRSASAQEGARR